LPVVVGAGFPAVGRALAAMDDEMGAFSKGRRDPRLRVEDIERGS